MSAKNKALVQRYVEEVLNQGNLAVIDELFAPTFVDHDSSMPEAKGPTGVNNWPPWFVRAFRISTSLSRT